MDLLQEGQKKDNISHPDNYLTMAFLQSNFEIWLKFTMKNSIFQRSNDLNYAEIIEVNF